MATLTSAPHIVRYEDLVTEADVELAVVAPLLQGSNYLEIPTSSIKAKTYLAATRLDKAAGKSLGYYPDFSVWECALPILIVEAKAPEVAAESGYREASLYARHLNQAYRAGLNPCAFLISTNGRKLLAGKWDSTPEIELDVQDLAPGSVATERLRAFCHSRLLRKSASVSLAQLQERKFYRPYTRAGGQPLLASTKPPNAFAADLSPLIRRYFTSTSQNDDPEIYNRAYVGTEEITEYDRILEALLKDRIASRRGSLSQDLFTTKTAEPKLSSAISAYRSERVVAGQLQLIIGGVGSGKSLFARRYKEVLQPTEQRDLNRWSFIDFNGAPLPLSSAQDWLCESYTESFSRENPGFDPWDEANLARIFSQDLQKRRGIYKSMREASSSDEARLRAEDLSRWQADPQKVAFGILRYFGGDRSDQGEVPVVVMDNVDRLGLDGQLAAFQLALWFLQKSRAFVILQMRDETYERFKDRPPLDTYRSGVTFHITAPRFLDVVKRRLELSLEKLSIEAKDRFEYSLGSGLRIVYPNSKLGEFLKTIYLAIFEKRQNVSRVLQGIAGTDVRRALEMFASILLSGHLSAEAITSNVLGAGSIIIPERLILKVLMRTGYRFFSEVSGFVANVFHCEDEWIQPTNFLVADIMFWLFEKRKTRGPIGLEGYFSVDQAIDVLQLRGYVPSDVVDACGWLLRRQLIQADHMNGDRIVNSDCMKLTASGFIHLRILCERIEYLYGVLTVTPIADEVAADQIAAYIAREGERDDINLSQKTRCVQLFRTYMGKQYDFLAATYPEFGIDRSGARYLLTQIDSALQHTKNATLFQTGNLLDEP